MPQGRHGGAAAVLPGKDKGHVRAGVGGTEEHELQLGLTFENKLPGRAYRRGCHAIR